MQPTISIIFIILLRSIIDAFGIYGCGLAIMGHKIKLRKLIKYACIISVIMTPIRFLPVNMGIQVNLIFLFMIIFLYYLQNLYLLTAAGAVLIGGWTLVNLEWLYTYIAEGLMFLPLPEPLTPASIFFTSPSAIIMMLLAVLLQFLIKDKEKKLENLLPLKDSHLGNRLKLIPTAQFFYMLLINMCLSLFYQQIPEWIPRLFPLLIFIILVFCFYMSKKWLESKNKTFLLFGILDLFIFVPLILIILFNTGGHRSIFKFLFIPLIIINTLKPNKYYGILSVIISGLSLFSFNIFFIGGQNYTTRLLEEDLIYTGTFIMIFWIINNALTFEEFLRNKILEKATTDELTGLFNSRYLYQYLESKKGKQFIIIMDLDNFKLVNDKLGHLTGDRLLEYIANKLKETTRKEDVVIRYGGDEFIVLPDNSLNKKQVLNLAERLRVTVKKSSSEFLSTKNELIKKPITASLGVARSNTSDINKLIKKADSALYEAKSSGKNKLYFLSF